MENKHIGRCSTLQATREMQIKTARRYDYTPMKMVQIKKSSAAPRGRTWTTDSTATLQTVLLKRRTTICPNKPTLRFTHKGKENRCPDRNLYTNIHSSVVPTSPEVGTSQVSING